FGQRRERAFQRLFQRRRQQRCIRAIRRGGQQRFPFGTALGDQSLHIYIRNPLPPPVVVEEVIHQNPHKPGGCVRAFLKTSFQKGFVTAHQCLLHEVLRVVLSSLAEPKRRPQQKCLLLANQFRIHRAPSFHLGPRRLRSRRRRSRLLFSTARLR